MPRETFFGGRKVLDRDASQRLWLYVVRTSDQGHVAPSRPRAGHERDGHGVIFGEADKPGTLTRKITTGLRHDRGALGITWASFRCKDP